MLLENRAVVSEAAAAGRKKQDTKDFWSKRLPQSGQGFSPSYTRREIPVCHKKKTWKKNKKKVGQLSACATNGQQQRRDVKRGEGKGIPFSLSLSQNSFSLPFFPCCCGHLSSICQIFVARGADQRRGGWRKLRRIKQHQHRTRACVY